MSVYVDPLMHHGWRLGKSSHMYADSLDELHKLAGRIGMHRSWFQDHPNLPHYDLTRERRARAVRLGAIETDWRHVVEYIRRRRESREESPDA